MKKARFSEEQMVTILREADQRPIADVAKKHSVSDQTIYAWRKRFGTLEPAEPAAVPHSMSVVFCRCVAMATIALVNGAISAYLRIAAPRLEP